MGFLRAPVAGLPTGSAQSGHEKRKGRRRWSPALKLVGSGWLLPVLLDTRGAQARKPVLVDRALPAQIFLDRQDVAFAGFFQTQQTAAHGRDNLSLAADHPTVIAGRRKIGDRERTAIGPDDVVYAWTQLTAH